jgi:protein-L-isoaspartate(D-aspartate) O-methyltransferase
VVEEQAVTGCNTAKAARQAFHAAPLAERSICDFGGFPPNLQNRGVCMASFRLAGQEEYARPRRRMAERLARRGVKDRRVCEAFAAVPRHRLLPEALRGQAYLDRALPIGEGQTISAPSVVAVMTQALELEGHEYVLEVGTGSAYQAAILSRLAASVVSIERVPRLAAEARTALDRLGVSNVVVYLGDGSRGRPQDAPFDAIVVTAGGPEVPRPLLEQLAPGGRLVGPFGGRDEQELLRVCRTGRTSFKREVIGRCRFVDLVGAHGWAT